MKKLKLFVWYNIRSDYTPGIAFALAYTVEEARQQIKKKSNVWEWRTYEHELMFKPNIYTKPFGFWMSGGA